MEFEIYKNQLLEYSAKYKTWWSEPFEKFREQYDNEHKDFSREFQGLEKYQQAIEQFKVNLRNKQDLLEEIYNFFDVNYETYIHATSDQRSEIRAIVSKSSYPSYRSSLIYYLEDVLFNYTNDRAITKLKQTGDKIWLLRGLVAISIENCGTDYRDTLISLANLYIAAEKKKINPISEFKTVANLSSNEEPRGGSTPMSQMMANIHKTALYREKTKKFLGLF